MTCGRCGYQFCWMCKGKYSYNHFKPWNLWGCPGGQTGGLAILGDDRCCCFNCSCGCGLAGKLKRLIFKLIYLACLLSCLPFVILCCPIYCIVTGENPFRNMFD